MTGLAGTPRHRWERPILIASDVILTVSPSRKKGAGLLY